MLKAGDPQVEPRDCRQVHHVEHENGRPAKIQHLMDKIKIPLEVGGVDNADDAVGLRRVGAATEEDVAHDRLVG